MKKIAIMSLLLGLFIMLQAQIPCVLIKWNTDSTEFNVVNFDYKPAFLPVIGLTPGLEVLVKRTPYAVPEYNSRLYVLSVQHNLSVDYDSEHAGNRMWLETYSLINRSVADKIVSVNDAKNYANYNVFPQQKHLEYLLIGLCIVNKKSSGLTLTEKEESILDKITDKGLLVWQNRINAEQKIDSLNAGAEVDLDYNWNDEDPETE